MDFPRPKRAPVFLRKSDSKLMRLIGWLLSPIDDSFMDSFWTTLILPSWIGPARIYLPTKYDGDHFWDGDRFRHERVQDSAYFADIIDHEGIHVWRGEQWTWIGLWLAYLGPSFFLLPAALLCFLYELGALLGNLVASWVLGYQYALPGTSSASEVGLYALLAGVLLLPLSAGLAWGRWFIEREAYMVQISRSSNPRARAERVVTTLWNSYLFPWPKAWMRAWFWDRIDEEGLEG